MEEPNATPEPKSEGVREAEPESGSEPVKEKSPEEEIRALKAGLEEKDAELRAAQEKLLRAYADTENFKKRMARDQIEQLRYSNEKLLKELLPVLDNLERALIHIKAAPELANWTEGVELICRQCLEVMKKFGVTAISSVGEVFDPNRHQAVTYLDTHDCEENHVAQELQKGYLFHERVLRPSMVAVARRPSPSSAPAQTSDMTEKQDNESTQ